jgi:proline dehydrogenase
MLSKTRSLLIFRKSLFARNVAASLSTKPPTPPPHHTGDGIDFSDLKLSLGKKSNFELVRSAMIFGVCRIPWIVTHSEMLLKTSYKLLGETITNIALRMTFFGHFCAGENEDDIRPAVNRLEDNGIGSILDYAAESDTSGDGETAAATPAPSVRPDVPLGEFDPKAETIVEGPLVQSRTYNYTNEEQCDQYMKIFENCIRSVKAVSPTGFAAIKVTALGDPALLERMSVSIIELQKLFLKFDNDGTGTVTREKFMVAYNNFFIGGEDVDVVFNNLDTDRDGEVDYIEWTNNIVIEDLYKLTSLCRVGSTLAAATLDEEERYMVKRMRARLYRLGRLAEELGVRVFIDAEHSYFQPAIDNLTVDLMKRFNVKYPAIYGTYQMYLKDSHHRLFTDLERARKGDYKFALKLVRGAYMIMERQRTSMAGLPDIIFEDIEGTHANYDQSVDDLLRRIAAGQDLEVMLATHNQASIEKAVNTMTELQLNPDRRIYFGQLLGMSDHLTYGLGRSGYKAYKYVPYGKIKEVMPYLLRRAQENSGMLGGAVNEMNLVKKELLRRMFG